MIPVVLNHDHTRVIGSIREANGGLLVEFTAEVRVTREMFFSIFGNTGTRLLEVQEHDGLETIRKAEIIEFSFSPQPAHSGRTGNGPACKQDGACVRQSSVRMMCWPCQMRWHRKTADEIEAILRADEKPSRIEPRGI